MKKDTIVTILEVLKYILGALIGWLTCVSAHAINLLP